MESRRFAVLGGACAALLLAVALALAPGQAEAYPPLATSTITDGGWGTLTNKPNAPRRTKVQCTTDVRLRCDDFQRDGGLPLADSTSEFLNFSTVPDSVKIDLAGTDQGCTFFNPDGGNSTCRLYPR